MRYLAIDLGDKRTGLAVGDDASGVVSPAGVVVCGAPHERRRQILRAVRDHGPDALVVGLPLNMDGTAGPAAGRCRDEARRLADASGLTVHLVDERATSQEADAQMARRGLTHGQKKARRDALAAANILRRFLGLAEGPGAP